MNLGICFSIKIQEVSPSCDAFFSIAGITGVLTRDILLKEGAVCSINDCLFDCSMAERSLLENSLSMKLVTCLSPLFSWDSIRSTRAEYLFLISQKAGKHTNMILRVLFENLIFTTVISIPTLVITLRLVVKLVLHRDESRDPHFRIVKYISQLKKCTRRVFHSHFFSLNHFITLR